MADEEPVQAPEQSTEPPVAEPEEAAEDAPVAQTADEQQADEPAAPVENDAPAENADAEATPPDAVNTEEPNAEGGEQEEGEEVPAEGKDVEQTAEGETEPPADGAEVAPTEDGEQTGDGEEKQAADEEPPTDGAEKVEGEAMEGSQAGEEPQQADVEAAGEAGEGADTGEEPQEPAQDGEAAERPATEEAPQEGQEETEPAVPQSDTFADGEKPESPTPHVGEVLSREGSPSAEQQKEDEEERTFSPPVADSPRESHIEQQFDVDVLEEEIISPEQDREALVEMYHLAIAEREQLQQQNHQLQHKLAEYFKKKKSDEQKTESVDKNEADQEQRYLKYMSQLEELRSEDQQIRDEYAMEIAELEQRCAEKKHEVDAHRAKFVEFKHQVALNSLNSRSGKPIPPKDIDQYISAEDRKDQEVIGVRLENIKLKNKLKKKEQQLKSKEELADGLHLIDFEQLKIENQTYNEKIEERNEELLKLRKKITNTVQVLTHLKEKLQFVQGENSLLKNKLKDVEGAVAQKRDVLTRTKQARDALRIDNHRLRQNCGLLGNEPLLRDFEERKDEADALKDRLERLKMQHAELTLNTSSVRRKIEQIKANEHN